jgi:prephenate dehydrogenase
LSPPFSFPRVALIGVGYIGGSAALAARQAGLVSRVVGYDLSGQACITGLKKGVLDASAATLAEAVRDADLVILAAPVGSLQGLLRDLAKVLGPQATVIDVGSVKAALVAAAEALLPSGQFVGCHPMAGAEYSGVESADAGIFAGRVCFLCPPCNAKAQATEAAQVFWRGIGCRVVAIDPETHDRLMAAQSHLPHVAAYALAGALLPSMPFLESTTTEASPTISLRDTTRIAASGPAVWRDILLANARHLLPLIAELESNVAEIKAAVATDDAVALERILVRGQSARQRLVKG